MFLVKFTSDDEIIILRVFAAKNLYISLILRLTTADFVSHHIGLDGGCSSINPKVKARLTIIVIVNIVKDQQRQF